MKRSQVVFVTVVFTALFTGLVMERTRRSDPFAVLTLPPPRAVPLEELDPPRGELDLAGRVEDAGRAGVPGVLVRLRPRAELAGGPGEPRALPLAWTVTDERGGFALHELSPGPWRAWLVAEGREAVTVDLELPADGPVRWRAGAPRPPPPDLEPLRRGTLRGVVLDGLGRPLAGLEVVARPAPDTPPLAGALVRRTRTDREGGFAFDRLALASYRIELLPAWAHGGSWPVLIATSITHDERSAEVPLELVFEPASISGTLRDQDGRPIAGALVQLWSAADADRVWPSVQSAPDGSFRLPELPAGSYALSIRAGAAAVRRELTLGRGEELVLDAGPLRPGLAAGG